MENNSVTLTTEQEFSVQRILFDISDLNLNELREMTIDKYKSLLLKETRSRILIGKSMGFQISKEDQVLLKNKTLSLSQEFTLTDFTRKVNLVNDEVALKKLIQNIYRQSIIRKLLVSDIISYNK